MTDRPYRRYKTILAAAVLVGAVVSARAQRVDKVLPSDGRYQDLFGTSIALSGDVLAVGAEDADSSYVNTGAVYLYQRDPDASNGWRFVKKFVAPDRCPQYR